MITMLILPAMRAANGDTSPKKPNPADAGVPTIWKIRTLKELIVAVIITGSPIIGCVKKLGIIFIAPRPIATVESGLIMIIENDIAIRILIKNGCNVVNMLIP